MRPVNAVRYNGADPVSWTDDKYYNIDAEKTIEYIHNETELRSTDHESPITINKQTGKRIASILPVHVWGNAAKLDELVPMCEERGIAVVEDASESLGIVYNEGRYFDQHTGTVGKLGCLSFNGNKIITTGGGGMILTDDKNLAKKSPLPYHTGQRRPSALRPR